MKLKDLNFTPAPWKVQTKEEFHLTEDTYHSIVAGNGYFDTEERNGFNLTSYINIDNAILISRAPEMLEKLKKAEEALRQVMQAKLSEEHWGLVVDCDSVLKEITDLLNS